MANQEKIVEVPGVGNIAFPSGMSDDAIAATIQGHLAKQSEKIDQMQADNPEIKPYYGFTPSNIASNLWESGKSLISSAADIGTDIIKNPNWIYGNAAQPSTVQKFVTDPAIQQEDLASQYAASGQTLRSLGHSAASAIPLVGPLAATLGEQARTDPGGATAQAAGMYLAGRAPEVVGKGVIEASKRLAPALAETSLGVGNKARAFGRTPGETLLKETEGMAPEAVLKSTKAAMNRIGSKIEVNYVEAGKQGKVASIQPAIDVLLEERAKALKQADTGLVEDIDANIKRLTTDHVAVDTLKKQLKEAKANGDTQLAESISTQIAYVESNPRITMRPDELWALKRGQGKGTNWNPNIDPGVSARLDRQVYGAIDAELDRVVPEVAQENQTYSSLVEVKRRADITQRSAGVVQGAAARWKAKTGALAAGAMTGYHYGGGLPWAIAGAAVGSVIPELITHPAVPMAAARGLSRVGRISPKSIPRIPMAVAGARRLGPSGAKKD